MTLGKVSQLPPEQARKTAADMLAAVRLGGDPALEKAERRASVTVGELIDSLTPIRRTDAQARNGGKPSNNI